MSKPPVLPELYTGEKSWIEWMDHFESIAAVCEWNDEAKLKWLRVRLTGRAGAAFRRLPEATRADFTETMKALQERFEPESKKELYRAELQTRTKKRNEDWAAFGDDLKLLADRAYPDLPDKARERFALNQYLTQLDNTQVAFGVRQAKPKVVDEAVRLTLEMESYLQPTRPSRTSPTLAGDHDSNVIGAASSQLRNDPLQQILERMDRLETELQSVRQPQKVGPSGDRGSTSSRKPRSRERVPTCWNCGGEGHLARDCPSPKKSPQQQGNDKPSMQ